MTSLIKNNQKIQAKKGVAAHLLTQIVKKQVYSQQLIPQQQKQCLYGVLCAHLRAQGKCQYPHKRSHYHFLNLVPPVDCINDEEGKELSKVQKKQQKIIEKTINQHIDVGKLNKIQHQLKNGGEKLIKKQIWQQIDDKEKKILEIVNSFDVSEIFIKLNEARNEDLPLLEVKRKATIQLKKKNETLYNEMNDKEYRIANRLIKAFAKNKSLSLYDLYVDINHDTIKSIRTYFESYFKQQEGIPQEIQVNQGQNQAQSKIYIKNLYEKLLFTKPEQYQHRFYVLKLPDLSLISQLRASIELFNMLVPFSIHKQQPFNKFYLLDCSSLTFTAISNLLTKDYLTTFHAKFKAAPEYLFGQLEQNEVKFLNWASKIHSKYAETQNEFKSIFILYNTSSILSKGDLQQFQMQKLRQRVTLLKKILSLFNSVLIVLSEDGIKNTKKKLTQMLEVDGDQISNQLCLE